MRNNLKIRLFTVLFTLTKPIEFINFILDPTMKARMLPLMGTSHISVFNRIIVNIIYMSSKILLVANQMFPKSPLPNAAFSSFDSWSWDGDIMSANVKPIFCKSPFYHRHLTEKLSSSSAIFHIQWQWSGKSTIANISKGCKDWTSAMARCRDVRAWELQNILRRLYVTTVKKNVPPSRNHRL